MRRSWPRLPACTLSLAFAVCLSTACNRTFPPSNAAQSLLDDRAIAVLRDRGPEGLIVLLDAYDAEAKRAKEHPRSGDDTRLARLRRGLDHVARQKEAYASRLYWFTDFDKAKRAARETGRPILSLRMLGSLDEELSCANSRFFRTAVYPDAQVSRVLREEFILYWSSERPAPVVTIDFGDGRTIQRTVTGNSLHYVMDSSGRPVDAIPGLYGPSAFVRAVEAAGALARATGALQGRERDEAIRAYHVDARRKLEVAWQDELVESGYATELARSTPLPGIAPSTSRPSAVLAAAMATSKAFVERPLVNALVAAPPATVTPPSETAPWADMARRHLADGRLDETSLQVMAAKNPMDWSSAPRPLTGHAFDAMVAGFERVMAEDTVRNEFTKHVAIHDWFIAEPGLDFRRLNQKVYSALFLTPASDPWLGLVPPLAYTGLENDGVVGRHAGGNASASPE